jgi:prefoldin subunit 5
MSKLPEKFPEYSIMYKTLSKQIKELKKRKENTQESEIEKIQLKIQRYQTELNKIKKMFPDNFFDERNEVS